MRTKYDQILLDVVQKTDDGVLEWHVAADVPRAIAWSEDGEIIRAFHCDYHRGQHFTLFLLERAERAFGFDSASGAATLRYELALAQGDALVIKLTEYDVSGLGLQRLKQAVERKNVELNGLLETFS